MTPARPKVSHPAYRREHRRVLACAPATKSGGLDRGRTLALRARVRPGDNDTEDNNMKLRIAGGSLRAVVVALMALALAPALAMADVEPNDGIEQAEGPLAGGVNHDGTISTENDVDWYVLYISQRAQMKFTLTTFEECGRGTSMRLRDTSGSELNGLFVSEDRTEELNLTLDPGRYFITMESECVGNRHRFRIDPGSAVGTGPAAEPAVPIGEPNDTREQAAGPLAHGQLYSSAIETENDVDWFTFNTGAPGPVNLALTSTGDCGVSAAIEDAAGDEVDSTFAADDRTEQIQFTAPQAERYFVRVTGCLNATYQLRVTGVISTSPPPSAAPPPAVMPGPSGTFPAKFQVRRSQVENKRLDMLVDVTDRANGDSVEIEFHARGRHHTFTETIEDGRLRFKELLPRAQRSVRTGIVTIRYAGNERVRPDEVRLRAASRQAKLERSLLSLQNGVLVAEGRITARARGVVRLRLTYDRPDGSVGAWDGRATVNGRSWRIEEALPPEAQNGGYLSMQFTGYQRRSVRGEQIAKQLLKGQVFQTD